MIGFNILINYIVVLCKFIGYACIVLRYIYRRIKNINRKRKFEITNLETPFDNIEQIVKEPN